MEPWFLLLITVTWFIVWSANCNPQLHKITTLIDCGKAGETHSKVSWNQDKFHVETLYYMYIIIKLLEFEFVLSLLWSVLNFNWFSFNWMQSATFPPILNPLTLSMIATICCDQITCSCKIPCSTVLRQVWLVCHITLGWTVLWKLVNMSYYAQHNSRKTYASDNKWTPSILHLQLTR